MTKAPPLLLLTRRPRRNRTSPSIRAMVTETHLTAHDFIQPIFIKDGTSAPEPVGSMPGIMRFNAKDAIREIGDIQSTGVQAIAIFPQIEPSLKDPKGNYALDSKNWFWNALKQIKSAHPQMLQVVDVALDPYTSHGHDGLVCTKTGCVLNDPTVEILSQYAVTLAECGVDFVAPSDMMDGRVGAIRRTLDLAGHTETGIIAYAAKYASSYYGPFRDAVGSAAAAGTHHLDKRGYQLNPANVREALLEVQLDEQEGADVVMVKPAGLYLDIIRQVKDNTYLPVAAYQVSGEYAQIHAAAEKGWLNLEKARFESLLAIKRAGADMILTYFAKDMAKELGQK